MDKSPDAFKTISEVAEDLDLPQHVLRFWETRFSQIKLLKRGGGRRYYRPDDIDLLRGIRHFLYDEGYTIKGLQRILKDEGTAFVQAIGRGEVVSSAAPPPMVETFEKLLQNEPFDPVPQMSGYPEPQTAQGNLFSALTGNAPSSETGGPLSGKKIKILKAVLDDLQECERVLTSLKIPV